ncbi:hypothetical protein HDV63DRAFT_109480 [Trichoderma sp. SZMC 28014]
MTNDTFASPSSSASAYSRPVNTSVWSLIQAKSLVDKRYQDPLGSLSLTSLTAVTHNLLPGVYFLCISPHDHNQQLAALVQVADRIEPSLTVARGCGLDRGFYWLVGITTSSNLRFTSSRPEDDYQDGQRRRQGFNALLKRDKASIQSYCLRSSCMQGRTSGRQKRGCAGQATSISGLRHLSTRPSSLVLPSGGFILHAIPKLRHNH